MNKFQLEECLQKQKEWYIHHPEALKKLVSEADYDFEVHCKIQKHLNIIQ